MLEFEYFDFIPRKEFKEEANKLLNQIGEQVPSDYGCEARCTFFANKFFFQITFRNNDTTIAAQTILDPKKENIRERNWQMKAIEHLIQLIQKQIPTLSKNLTLKVSGE